MRSAPPLKALVALFNDIDKDFGGIDGLINNAGITKDSLLVKVHEEVVGKMSVDDFNKVISVDLKGVFLCGREAAQHMIDGGPARRLRRPVSYGRLLEILADPDDEEHAETLTLCRSATVGSEARRLPALEAPIVMACARRWSPRPRAATKRGHDQNGDRRTLTKGRKRENRSRDLPGVYELL